MIIIHCLKFKFKYTFSNLSGNPIQKRKSQCLFLSGPQIPFEGLVPKLFS